MFLFPILFIIFIVCFVMLFFRGGANMQNPNSPPQSIIPIQNALMPIDILNLRYAKGEITEDEYQKIKKNLQSWICNGFDERFNQEYQKRMLQNKPKVKKGS